MQPTVQKQSEVYPCPPCLGASQDNPPINERRGHRPRARHGRHLLPALTPSISYCKLWRGVLHRTVAAYTCRRKDRSEETRIVILLGTWLLQGPEKRRRYAAARWGIHISKGISIRFRRDGHLTAARVRPCWRPRHVLVRVLASCIRASQLANEVVKGAQQVQYFIRRTQLCYYIARASPATDCRRFSPSRGPTDEVK